MSPRNDLAAACIDLFHQQQYTEADTLARQGLQRFPEDGLLWQLHGSARWFLADFAVARHALETASSLAPLQPLARVALAGAYARTGDTFLARELYIEVLQDECFPSGLLPKVSVGLGLLGEFWHALQACRKLARLRPTHHAAFFGLAYYMARLDYPAECYHRHLLRAHQLAPDVLPYRINLAFLLVNLGQGDEACALVRDVAPDAVACACWVRRLADLFETNGETERARAFQARLEALTEA